jgi:hypothetical protein
MPSLEMKHRLYGTQAEFSSTAVQGFTMTPIGFYI